MPRQKPKPKPDKGSKPGKGTHKIFIWGPDALNMTEDEWQALIDELMGEEPPKESKTDEQEQPRDKDE